MTGVDEAPRRIGCAIDGEDGRAPRCNNHAEQGSGEGEEGTCFGEKRGFVGIGFVEHFFNGVCFWKFALMVS